ncbi:MAG TPA: adenylate/guanylate cyclase domain-containing protein [Acidimicrobiales bacterium]|nr:adenylate/guanylate cyclase domain-containing protein [Acidimicrobiales bacterium]
MAASDDAELQPLRVFCVTVARLAAANLVGAVLVFVFLDRIFPAPLPFHQAGRDQAISLIGFLAYLGFSFAVGAVTTKRVVKQSYRWLVDGTRPTPAEQAAVLREPWRSARFAFGFWLGAAVVFATLNIVFGAPALVVLRVVFGILLAGLTTCTLAFLLVERSMRPVFAAALAGTAPRRQRVLGLRPRLMLSWALGSGVPFLAVVLAVVGHSVGDGHTVGGDLRLPVAFLAVVGLLGGWLCMFVAARSVADPLEDMRAAVGAVERGRLDVDVTVDDGGEVGLLQAGFNRMVAGLRERQQLRDLFGRHVGDEVARQALERQAGLGGEVRQASALFVDLIGSTNLAATRPADEVVATLNALFDAVVRTVAAEGGWVNKFEGDGALCVFGAPADQPDHAARALQAARAMRDELHRLSAAHPALDAGIGVSSGTVVAGNVGAEERYEYTVVGDPVNEAARLTELAKDRPERVLASQAVVQAAGAVARQWHEVGAFTLRGRSAPTCAYAPDDAAD